MRLGTLRRDGSTFLVHVHVIPAASDEVAELRTFRDRLRADRALVAAYVARKREIIAAGTPDYTKIKGEFIATVLTGGENH